MTSFYFTRLMTLNYHTFIVIISPRCISRVK